MSEDPRPDDDEIRRRQSDERLKQAMDEMALREGVVAELTGDEPPLELRFFYDELITLLRLLNMLEGVERFAGQAGPLIDTINRQMEGRWDPPEGWTPPPPR